jgi:hypothetical protein
MTFRSGYNDAWETRGWTAQNMSYPPPDSNILNLPTDIETVTISGHFRDGDGGFANGWFDIDNGKTVLRHTSTKEIITPIKIRTEIKDGTFSVTVPATDATPLTSDPNPWTYSIRVALDGREFATAVVSLPKANAAVDVFDLI